MASSLTLTTQGRMLDWQFTAAALPARPAAWFVALHVGPNGGAGAANEIVGDGYARQPVTFTRAGNVITNTAALAFGPDTTAAWGSVTDVTIWDALTGGNCLAQGTDTAAVTFAVGDSATIAAGALSLTLN